ncbi:MAG TPA: MFS transporter [Mycobacteriales bacterium]|jgi:DHA1 family multidrug resistance protein-like MFS transporter|nr:MFS transporter [Mycobacteriales bacterium]
MHRWARLGLSAETPPAAIRIVQALVVAEFLQGLGASAVLPLLPLYLRNHGTSVAVVGMVMGSYFVAGVFTQYGAGHLADRTGHRGVILGGLATYAVASVGFALPVGAGGYIVLRALQGTGAGAVQVAGLALVGVVVPAGGRGRAFAAVFAAQLAGMAIGPLAGSAAGVSNLHWLFIATAVVSLSAAIPVTVGTPRAHLGGQNQRAAALAITQPLVGLLLVAVTSGLIVGVYESCWSLLMSSRGAAAWQIGLSWTLFALPFAAFSPLAGRLVDRLDRRLLAMGSLIVTCGFAATYPFLPHVWLLMALGTVEAVGVAIAYPAAQSMLSQSAVPEALGRAQGAFTTAQTAAVAVAAAASGAMFGVARWVPFVTAAVVGTALSLTLPVLLRAMPARASTGDAPGFGEVGGPEVAAAGALPAAVRPGG